MPKRKKPKIRVVERKMRREHALGQCWQGEGLIELEPRQRARCYFGTLLHECLHAAFPDLSENKVAKAEKLIIKILWDQGYRKVRL